MQELQTHCNRKERYNFYSDFVLSAKSLRLAKSSMKISEQIFSVSPCYISNFMSSSSFVATASGLPSPEFLNFPLCKLVHVH